MLDVREPQSGSMIAQLGICCMLLHVSLDLP